MVADKPKTTYRKDYKPTPFLVEKLELTFLLDEEFTTVRSRLHLVPNPASPRNGAPELSLDGAPRFRGTGWDAHHRSNEHRRSTLRLPAAVERPQGMTTHGAALPDSLAAAQSSPTVLPLLDMKGLCCCATRQATNAAGPVPNRICCKQQSRQHLRRPQRLTRSALQRSGDLQCLQAVRR